PKQSLATARFQAGPTTGFYVLPLFTSIFVNNFASTIVIIFPSGDLLEFTSSQSFFLILFQIFSLISQKN
ncbi:MAG: hypothetical protein PVG06_19675, partial [Desulfobacterales bacterium]